MKSGTISQAGARGGGRISPTRLARRGSRGSSLCPLYTHAPAQYQRFTTQEVCDAFARYDRPGARFRFVITPRP